MAGRLHQASSACLSSLLPRLSRRSISSISLNSRRFSSRKILSLASSSVSLSTRACHDDILFSLKESEFASEEDLRFESPLKIVEYPDPILRAKNKRIKTFDDKSHFVIGLLSFNCPVTEAGMVPHPNDQPSSPYVVISGCNNNCEVACCYCNILQVPPVCEKCCHPSYYKHNIKS